ncbi:MAG: beta-galactosidase [Bacteroidales bacterium]|nr:beta-galactosidase [Bacteroidales bacterium]
MSRNIILGLLSLILLTSSGDIQKLKTRQKFALGTTDFLLNGQPFQIISGELHPARIPVEYWRHRIRMAKAMGCNTISIYVFWNHHETEEGVFDFSTGNRNLAEFIRLVKEEEMWMILRPGPYVCAEWELGGVPPYLLRIPDISLRSLHPAYMAAAERYMKKLAEVIKPWLVTNGGPILMLQIENEYGSFGNDKNYLQRLKEIWIENGIDVPFFTADGPTTQMLEAGTLPGCAVGLDSGSKPEHFELAEKINPGVPVFSSETYPGWLTHWGEDWARPDTSELYREIKFLMDNKKSFNLYVLHGGTNFGFTAGANSGGKGYQPDVTSYDYDAPVDEQGRPTPKYMALRKIIGSYLPKGKKLPEIPEPVPSFEIPVIGLNVFTSIWDNLPQPVVSEKPLSFEELKQDYGYVLYRTELSDYKKGTLSADGLHDFATVFLDGEFAGILDRREGVSSLELPESKSPNPVLEIFVEGMGRINYGKNMIDRKGIIGDVTIDGKVVSNWKMYGFPMDNRFIYNLRSTGKNLTKKGLFFKASFFITETADTYFELSNFTKGFVWINGHNLGRYWNIGPQKRLYCPASWMRTGQNEILIFDMIQTRPGVTFGFKTME